MINTSVVMNAHSKKMKIYVDICLQNRYYKEIAADVCINNDEGDHGADGFSYRNKKPFYLMVILERIS